MCCGEKHWEHNNITTSCRYDMAVYLRILWIQFCLLDRWSRRNRIVRVHICVSRYFCTNVNVVVNDLTEAIIVVIIFFIIILPIHPFFLHFSVWARGGCVRIILIDWTIFRHDETRLLAPPSTLTHICTNSEEDLWEARGLRLRPDYTQDVKSWLILLPWGCTTLPSIHMWTCVGVCVHVLIHSHHHH